MGWMVRNRVTANLIMLVLLAGGLLMATTITQEVFPQYSLQRVKVTVTYPGATPKQLEQNVVLAIESKVRGINGVKKTTATASQGVGTVTLKLQQGTHGQQVFQDVSQAVNQVQTFPEAANKPIISLSHHERGVLNVQLYGKVRHTALRSYAEKVRDKLLASPDITQVSLTGVRKYVVRINVPQATLKKYDLSLPEIGNKVRQAAVDVAGGSIDTGSGQILVRLKARKEAAREFAHIPIITQPDGSVVRLGQIATVVNGFEQSHKSATYNGQPSIGIAVSRAGKQTPIAIADATRQAMDKIADNMPPQLHYAINGDASRVYAQRLEMLLRNAGLGLLLVIIILGLFLEMRLAFWVMMGIPTAFIGALILLPAFNVTINMVSMFAFIVALGIVVDDAIIAGESVYAARERGLGPIDAAITGAREIAVPISFSILTNIVAFLPLLIVPGVMGQLFSPVTLVVISVLLISWAEALFIMPAHLAHGRVRDRNRLIKTIHTGQQGFANRFSTLVAHYYAPAVRALLRWRYVTSATGFAVLMVVIAWAGGGHMGFSLMPRVESNHADATLTMPFGTSSQRMKQVRDKLEAAADKVKAKHGGNKLVTGVFSHIDRNEIQTKVYLSPPDQRPISTVAFADNWRQALPPIAGSQSTQFQSNAGGPGAGKSVAIELAMRNSKDLRQAAQRLASELKGIQGTDDVDSGVAEGKRQINFTLNEAGRSLGLTNENVGRQVRAAFYGNEALRELRGRNEVKVMVTLPEDERGSAASVANLLIKTPADTYVRLNTVADIQNTRASTKITRRNGRRNIEVSANVTPPSDSQRVVNTLNNKLLPQLQARYPDLTFSYGSRQKDLQDSLDSLFIGFFFALAGIYILLAIPFASYTQPIIVMLSIPFAIVGAIIGHEIMGFSLSIISLMGTVALAGVVVNDSLVLIHYANTLKRAGESAARAVELAAIRRFRPILLTTLTTFGGLVPMIFATSIQAKFIVPMAISLGFGILFATAITLILVPCFYVILDDITSRFTPQTP
ncbi:efflux RND transporter permease subunit [Salinisphaera sp. USBA-960]|nr:efflux RND transporter permease subunit [Salifodinibacter halophilus]NNC25956.1 efflux RND transporter permease subunit [Salifodinibacter halophilus]